MPLSIMPLSIMPLSTMMRTGQQLLRSSAIACLALPAAWFAWPAAAMETLVVDSQTVPVYYDLHATLEAVNKSTISAQTSGQVLKLHYDVNDRVEQGALLLELDSSAQQARLAQSLAQLSQAVAKNDDAQTAFRRTQRLFKQGTVSQGQFDSAEAQARSSAAAVDAAKAAVQQAELAVSYTRVTAPYAGIVTARFVEIGELVNPGQPLMSGLALTPLRAVSDVPQRLVQQMTATPDVTVLFAGEQIFPDSTTLFPYADAALHSVRLRARIDTPAPGMLPGMLAKLRLQTAERQTLLVPQSALVERSEVAAVYVHQPRGWSMRQVRTGARFDDQVEILSGLSAGAVVAVDGYAALAQLDHSESAATDQQGE